MKNQQSIQGILSIAALVCLAVGWFKLFSPGINNFLYQKLFYILLGLSFFFQAPMLSNKQFLYPMYIAAALCIIGAFIPAESRFSAIKTIGLLAGVIMSMFGRSRSQQN